MGWQVLAQCQQKGSRPGASWNLTRLGSIRVGVIDLDFILIQCISSIVRHARGWATIKMLNFDQDDRISQALPIRDNKYEQLLIFLILIVSVIYPSISISN